MSTFDDIVYAPIRKKRYMLRYMGTTSAHCKGPLEEREALELLAKALKDYGTGYTLEEVTWSVTSSSGGYDK